ncbi:MAG: hypothetical protein EOO48_05495 [Flavobacterium sp.]|nr:MAG: hypothetical protein EOO48_05495 [Flavobacterium sp.]
MKYTLALLLLFFFPNVWSQEDTRKELKGKVTSSISGLEGIYVVNTSTEAYTSTTAGGYFTIMAKPGDSLMFSSVQIKGKQVELTADDFTAELFFVKLEPLVHELDEVIIDKWNNINAVSLGIISPDQKRYTPAERKLRASDGSQNRYGLNSSISFDGILNGLSGRTAMLRKEVETEKKETLMKRLEDWFEEKYFVDQLKIPAEYVHGFLFYIVESDRFATAVNFKNKTSASFLLAEMAVKYKDTIACDLEK